MRRSFGFTGFGFGNIPANRAVAAGESLGSELLSNGTFSDGSAWTLDGDVPPTISGEQLRADATPDACAAIQFPAHSAGTYRIVFTIVSITDGSAACQIGTNALTGATATRTAPGTFSEDVVSDGEDQFTVTMITDGSIVIDNVSCRQVL